jgi:hypothetical protein
VHTGYAEKQVLPLLAQKGEGMKTIRERLKLEREVAIKTAGGESVWESKDKYWMAWESMVKWLERFGLLDAHIVETTCPSCDGKGQVEYDPGEPMLPVISSCIDCNGSGRETVVVMPEAFAEAEAIVLAACEKAHDDEVAHPGRVVEAIVLALFPGVE